MLNDVRIQARVVEASMMEVNRYHGTKIRDEWEKLTRIDREEIWELLMTQAAREWYGAVPTWEPTGFVRFSESEAIPVSGSDGSQIFPDPNSPVQWGYVQAVSHMVGKPPKWKSEFLDLGSWLTGDLSYSFLPDNSNVTEKSFNDVIAYARAKLEMDVAALWVKEFTKLVTLLDNPLYPRIYSNSLGVAWQQPGFLTWLDDMHGRLVAGIVSSPRSKFLSGLINLSESGSLTNKSRRLRRVTDSAIAGNGLKVGQRSALFKYGNLRSDLFENSGTEIFFFFLKVNEREVERVEIPGWVAKDPSAVDVIQASILKDSEVLGYPFVLAQAHHQVTIPLDVATQFHRMATAVYLEHGGRYWVSAKNRVKFS